MRTALVKSEEGLALTPGNIFQLYCLQNARQTDTASPRILSDTTGTRSLTAKSSFVSAHERAGVKRGISRLNKCTPREWTISEIENRPMTKVQFNSTPVLPNCTVVVFESADFNICVIRNYFKETKGA